MTPAKDPSRNIADCHPYLAARWPQLRKMFQDQTGMDLILTCTWRSIAAQQRLYAQGRTTPGQIVTWVDGVKKVSNHNFYPARAFDVAVDSDRGPAKVKLDWNDKDYVPLVGICKKLGLVSGGSWMKNKDWPHVEIPAGVI